VDMEDGDAARTEFRVLSRDSDSTTLLEARPLTGRTNQIRIHLWQLGYPIAGDQVYLPGMVKGNTQTLTTEDTPMCLHAWRIGFTHPLTGERLIFEMGRPEWGQEKAR